MQITSASNEKIKYARRVREGREPSLIFVEGVRLAEEAFRSGLSIALALTAPVEKAASTPRILALVEEFKKQGAPVFETTPDILRALGDTVQTQGIILVAHRPESAELPASAPSALLLGFDRLQDPGNLGTLLRTAEAAGVSGIVSLQGSADAFSPKVLRSAMGSAFRLPIQADITPELLLELKRQHGFQMVAAAAGPGSSDYDAYDWCQPTLLLLGNEGQGVSPALMQHCDARLCIPMQAGVESLNVAAAGAVMLFEAARQRRSRSV